METKSLKKYKKDAVKAADELGYKLINKSIVIEISKAKSETEIDKILLKCRQKM